MYYFVGVCYKNGQGVEKNLAEAVKYYRLAAQKGNASAQCNLGMCALFVKSCARFNLHTIIILSYFIIFYGTF